MEKMYPLLRLNGCVHTHKTQTHTRCLTYETQIVPLHGYFPFARLSGVHIIKVSSVVVWVCATEDQLSAWRVFWVPEKK